MGMEKQDHHSSFLGQTLDRHFLACAAAATAGVAGMAGSADAAIQYSGLLDLQPDHTSPKGVYVDIDNFITEMPVEPDNATSAWQMNIYNVNPSFSAVRLLTPDNLSVPDTSRNFDPIGFVGVNGYSYITKEGAGVSVGAGSAFVEATNNVAFSYFAFRGSSGAYDVSPWDEGAGEGYMGFQFTSNGNTHYGWARLVVAPFSDPNRPFGITLRDFAYEDVAGQAITTGAIPEPAGLALGALALGAIAVRPSRKQ